MRLVKTEAPPAASPLEVSGVTAAYGSEPVLWDVSFRVPEGQLVAVVGPNGAGKTTLLKVVMGLMEPAAGRATVFGKPFSKARQLVGYVPQRGSVDWDFPTDALDVVQMGLYGKLGWFRRPGRREREKAMECLEKVGMAEFAGRQISQLSGGQQQRIFLARALAQEARLYLTDEPFAGVDYKTEQAIVELLRDLKAAGGTVVVVHHDLATVPDYFDRVVILNRRLVAEGPVEEVFTRENVSDAYGGAVSYLAGAE
ncbi:MAG: Manganese ABC transporter, ATP-binding protein SitB [uncultured Rubrobacteraceae bacterium]|uniref:Manganese ABC transporter, ATP-binding protein SitB n=1 Tax=uncultured Rubrobacteraceae bacterium TaxID=349277 RepID=A0A6J4RIQ4_9ACTN|nr:MAG: Manganese ABC transporter, ATP-binding protein SitB [uncultured Rubrobacteraceae bacterium]